MILIYIEYLVVGVFELMTFVNPILLFVSFKKYLKKESATDIAHTFLDTL